MSRVPAGHKVLKEGSAHILYIEEKMETDENNRIMDKVGKKVGKLANEVNETRGAVFYNPVQEFNRDISILAINEYNELVKEERAAKNKTHDGLDILEALAATGLRSVRYLKEIPSIKTLIANDIDPTATELMTNNFKFNECSEEKYRVETRDAIDLMNEMRANKKKC